MMPKRSTLKATKRIVERLKADDKDAIFWDSFLTGIRGEGPRHRAQAL